MNAPGFVASLVPSVQIATGMSRVYTLVGSPSDVVNTRSKADVQSWLVGTGVSGAVYIGLCYLSPPPGMNRHFVEIDESAHETRFGVDSEEHVAHDGEGSEKASGEKDISARVPKENTQVHVLAA